jgi:hypothetical protein
MLPTVDFCGLTVTRLVIGANPFGGFSHQNSERDAEMVGYYTPERIRETWRRAEAAGINTMVTNNETPHVMQAVRDYRAEGGPLQWIAQLADRPYPSMIEAIDDAVATGAKAAYFHGGLVDGFYAKREDETLRTWVDHARSLGLPIGVAGHAPQVHDWVASLDLVDFHVVCFFNCGSLHSGQGQRFRLADVAPAAECCARLEKPCIAYKVMGAGRIDPVMALEFAFEHIKPGDVVNVGVHRGDKDDMVEENVALVREILGR